jgi:ATP-binding cassette subfamily F protein 3
MLQIDNLVFNGWGRRFFDSATVSLPVGAKVGLVGRNGVGKSTLFKLILGQLAPDGGEIIPSPIDQNRCAHWRNPMDMMRQG